MRYSLCIALVMSLVCLPASAAQALPARDIAGVVVHPWQMADRDTLERTFAGIAATGVHWARVDLRWCNVEPTAPALASGRPDWSEMDAIVDAAGRHGVKLLPILGSVPSWASAAGDFWSFPYARPFEDFFAAALRRYPQISAWEVWNEPNYQVFSKPHPDPGGFVELLRSARRARDRVGSRAKLIAGGLVPVGAFGIRDWVDQVARRGGLELVDGLGVHPYDPEDPDSPTAWMMRLEALHAHLAALGKPNLPLWLTEYGAPTMPAANGYGPPLSEQQVAQRLRLAFALVTRWRWVENLTWYEYRDGCGDSTNAECNFGLVHQDLSPKPAYQALRDVVARVTTRLRPRLAVSSRVERAHGLRARSATHARRKRRMVHRLTVRGTLLLPGSGDVRTRVTVRLVRRGTRPPRVSVVVRNGRFVVRLRGQGNGRWTVEVRYAGSRSYERVVARLRVGGRR